MIVTVVEPVARLSHRHNGSPLAMRHLLRCVTAFQGFLAPLLLELPAHEEIVHAVDEVAEERLGEDLIRAIGLGLGQG